MTTQPNDVTVERHCDFYQDGKMNHLILGIHNVLNKPLGGGCCQAFLDISLQVKGERMGDNLMS